MTICPISVSLLACVPAVSLVYGVPCLRVQKTGYWPVDWAQCPKIRNCRWSSLKRNWIEIKVIWKKKSISKIYRLTVSWKSTLRAKNFSMKKRIPKVNVFSIIFFRIEKYNMLCIYCWMGLSRVSNWRWRKFHFSHKAVKEKKGLKKSWDLVHPGQRSWRQRNFKKSDWLFRRLGTRKDFSRKIETPDWSYCKVST